MAVNRDLYYIIGVPPISTAEEIRKAYRALSKKYHPDLNPDKKLYADEKMKELVDAYNILNDENKRKEYNKQIHFMVKKFNKDSKRKRSKQDASSFTKKPTYEKEPSILERILSPFMKNKDKDSPVPSGKVDYKQCDVQFTLGLTMSENDSFFEHAKKAFKQAHQFDPTCSEALYNLALMCYKLGEFDEARINYQKYLALEKDDQNAKKMLTLLREDIM